MHIIALSGAAALLLMAVASPALASGRQIPVGPKVEFGSTAFGSWTAIGVTVLDYDDKGKDLPSGAYCTAQSDEIEITQFIEAGRVPYTPMQFEMVSRKGTRLGLMNLTEVILGSRRYDALWVDVVRSVEERQADSGKRELELQSFISTAPVGYLGLQAREDAPRFPIEHLIDEMAREKTIEFKYDAAESGEEPLIRSKSFKLEGLAQSLKWCQEALYSDAWLHYRRPARSRD
jgi:hypothetical protein